MQDEEALREPQMLGEGAVVVRHEQVSAVQDSSWYAVEEETAQRLKMKSRCEVGEEHDEEVLQEVLEVKALLWEVQEVLEGVCAPDEGEQREV